MKPLVCSYDVFQPRVLLLHQPTCLFHCPFTLWCPRVYLQQLDVALPLALSLRRCVRLLHVIRFKLALAWAPKAEASAERAGVVTPSTKRRPPRAPLTSVGVVELGLGHVVGWVERRGSVCCLNCSVRKQSKPNVG